MSYKEIILAPFLVDAYSLGLHWIYDEKQLKDLPIDWKCFNDAQAQWHRDKKAGDFTHYGDHCLWLLESVSKDKKFDPLSYAKFWQEQMQDYNGYIDGSSREYLEHLEAGKSPREGVINHDLSICGRIAPLLLVSDDKESFISSSLSFAKMTHNDPMVLESVHFFANLLYTLFETKNIQTAIDTILEKYSETLKAWVKEGIASKNADTFDTVRSFGPACGIEEGFKGVIHLICKYDTLDDMMLENAKAGGDSSARGMTAAMLLSVIDTNTSDLLTEINSYEKILALL